MWGLCRLLGPVCHLPGPLTVVACAAWAACLGPSPQRGLCRLLAPVCHLPGHLAVAACAACAVVPPVAWPVPGFPTIC